MMTLTRAQREALKRIYDRDPAKYESYRAMRRQVHPGPDCAMIQWCGMWLGIEKDGYTHS